VLANAMTLIDKPQKTARVAAFTLIEVSIVLVIIALIIGGILVGREMINAAVVRDQISQIHNTNRR